MNDDIAGEGRRGRIMPDECCGSQIMSSDLVLLSVASGSRGGQTSVSRTTIISQYDTVRLSLGKTVIFYKQINSSASVSPLTHIWPLHCWEVGNSWDRWRLSFVKRNTKGRLSLSLWIIDWLAKLSVRFEVPDVISAAALTDISPLPLSVSILIFEGSLVWVGLKD